MLYHHNFMLPVFGESPVIAIFEKVGRDLIVVLSFLAPCLEEVLDL